MMLPDLDPDEETFPKNTGVFMRACSEEEILRTLT